MATSEQQIEHDLIAKLSDLKYTYRPDIRDLATLKANFRAKFEALNRVHLTDSEFQRLVDGIITPDVYNAAQILRNINSFERDDGTPLNVSGTSGTYTLRLNAATANAAGPVIANLNATLAAN